MDSEMRFVHRWVSRLCWVCNFCNGRVGGGGIAKCVSCIMLGWSKSIPLKKNFSRVSTMCRQLGSGTNQLDGVNKMVLIRQTSDLV